jgi:ferredoxin/Ca2+/Na+ antiporter
MNWLISVILAGFGFLCAFIFGAFAWISAREGERRAAQIALAAALVGMFVLFAFAALPFHVQRIILGFMILVGFAAFILFWLPIGKVETGNDTPSQRFDERRIMFARARLQPGSPEYEIYYRLHPEDLASDERMRAQPGLLSPNAKFANNFHFSSANGSFQLTDALRSAVDGPVNGEQVPVSTHQITRYIDGLARYYGALDVGVTELRPYHVYSHVGRGMGVYGEAIEIEHTHAIAFTVEMDFDMVGTAPKSTATMESARQYVEAARVAIQLANAIRNLGYSARAHIDGNYQVIAPLVGRDAGLGEIGRMSLLMTPRQGPRVRLGVVTTDLALQATPRKPDPTVIDFCNICKKCAENCPSRSIPFGERQAVDGAVRWKLDEETCFRYWNAVGTDCGRCMAVCPYAHPDNLFHNLVRWGIAHSGAFRRLALWMDDLFYGKKPAEREAPGWAKVDCDQINLNTKVTKGVTN